MPGGIFEERPRIEHRGRLLRQDLPELRCGDPGGLLIRLGEGGLVDVGAGLGAGRGVASRLRGSAATAAAPITARARSSANPARMIAGPVLAKALPVRAVTTHRFVDHMLTVTVPSLDRLPGVTRAVIITPYGLSLVNRRSDFP